MLGGEQKQHHFGRSLPCVLPCFWFRHSYIHTCIWCLHNLCKCIPSFYDPLYRNLYITVDYFQHFQFGRSVSIQQLYDKTTSIFSIKVNSCSLDGGSIVHANSEIEPQKYQQFQGWSYNLQIIETFPIFNKKLQL